ncbi:hypothetical protein [Serratia fonticola]|uniref:hypothetical protein n=1 Tax=Serratia fonticola TaxID=47917 RepID=UPI003AB0AEC4|nr:hypothetical protein [Serratia fonticola]HBE9088481.1 hypothetical protein [Serratia fonticola]
MFNFNHTPDDAAFHMALALAAKDDSVKTPEQLIAKIDEYFAACSKLINERVNQQHR